MSWRLVDHSMKENYQSVHTDDAVLAIIEAYERYALTKEWAAFGAFEKGWHLLISTDRMFWYLLVRE